MGLGGDVEADLVVVEQHPHRSADGDAAEGAVVATAALAHPQAGRRDREARREHHVGRADGVDTEPWADGLEQATTSGRSTCHPRCSPCRLGPSPQGGVMWS